MHLQNFPLIKKFKLDGNCIRLKNADEIALENIEYFLKFNVLSSLAVTKTGITIQKIQSQDRETRETLMRIIIFRSCILLSEYDFNFLYNSYQEKDEEILNFRNKYFNSINTETIQKININRFENYLYQDLDLSSASDLEKSFYQKINNFFSFIMDTNCDFIFNNIIKYLDEEESNIKLLLKLS